MNRIELQNSKTPTALRAFFLKMAIQNGTIGKYADSDKDLGLAVARVLEAIDSFIIPMLNPGMDYTKRGGFVLSPPESVESKLDKIVLDAFELFLFGDNVKSKNRASLLSKEQLSYCAAQLLLVKLIVTGGDLAKAPIDSLEKTYHKMMNILRENNFDSESIADASLESEAFADSFEWWHNSSLWLGPFPSPETLVSSIDEDYLKSAYSLTCIFQHFLATRAGDVDLITLIKMSACACLAKELDQEMISAQEISAIFDTTLQLFRFDFANNPKADSFVPTSLPGLVTLGVLTMMSACCVLTGDSDDDVCPKDIFEYSKSLLAHHMAFRGEEALRVFADSFWKANESNVDLLKGMEIIPTEVPDLFDYEIIDYQIEPDGDQMTIDSMAYVWNKHISNETGDYRNVLMEALNSDSCFSEAIRDLQKQVFTDSDISQIRDNFEPRPVTCYGMMLLSGAGVQQSFTEAFNAFVQASDAGNKEAAVWAYLSSVAGLSDGADNKTWMRFLARAYLLGIPEAAGNWNEVKQNAILMWNQLEDYSVYEQPWVKHYKAPLLKTVYPIVSQILKREFASFSKRLLGPFVSFIDDYEGKTNSFFDEQMEPKAAMQLIHECQKNNPSQIALIDRVLDLLTRRRETYLVYKPNVRVSRDLSYVCPIDEVRGCWLIKKFILLPYGSPGRERILSQALDYLGKYAKKDGSVLRKWLFENKGSYPQIASMLKTKQNSQDNSAVINKRCYVATCVYGSYDCPEVWLLRRYRDQYLSSHWFGRGFIKLYYSISPLFVRLFGKRPLFRKVCKRWLDKRVEKLRKKGYEDSAYSDPLY